ncbi:MAG: MarR family transcriptional regulator, partial [Proteobacteria bacterium]
TRRGAALDVLKKFRQVFRAAKLHFGTIEKLVGVSGAQLWAMSELNQHPGMRVTDLAEAMALHQSTVSNLLDKLMRRRLIRRERGDADGRVVRLYLTAAGQKLVRGAPAPARGVLPDALEHLPPAALTGLGRHLDKLLEGMRVKVPAAAWVHLQDL